MSRTDLQCLIVLAMIMMIILAKAIGTPEDQTRWRFDYLVQMAEARTQPCLRTSGPACPRPEPLVPSYCPFPVGGTP